MVSGKYDQIKLLFLAQVILVTKSENLALHSICRSRSTKGQQSGHLSIHLSVKLFLFDMFDQTPHHTLDKIMAKLVPMKNDLKA